MSASSPTSGEWPGTEQEDQAVVDRALQRRYGRLEIPRRAAVMFAAAGGLWAFGAMQLSAAAETTGLVVATFGAAVLVLLAMRAGRDELLRSQPDSDDEWGGCYLEDGMLMPVLADGEVILEAHAASGPEMRLARRGLAMAQTALGLILAGLPLAVAQPEPGESMGFGVGLWVAVLSLAGALMFGSGLRLLVGSTVVGRFVLTSQRLVAMAAPGAAKSLALEDLRTKPAVIERRAGDATLAVSFSRLVSMGLLPFYGIWGFDSMGREDARRWAESIVLARRKALGIGNEPTSPRSAKPNKLARGKGGKDRRKRRRGRGASNPT